MTKNEIQKALELDERITGNDRLITTVSYSEPYWHKPYKTLADAYREKCEAYTRLLEVAKVFRDYINLVQVQRGREILEAIKQFEELIK